MRNLVSAVLITLAVFCPYQTPLYAQGRLLKKFNVELNSSGLSQGTTSALHAAVSRLSGQWSSGTKLPAKKAFHAVASLDGYVYVFAGESFQAADERCFRYRIASDTWEQLSDFPVTAFLEGVAEAVDGKIYIFGGTTGYSSLYSPIRNMWEYDPLQDRFTERASMPIAQCMGSSAVIDGKIYYVGGMGSNWGGYLSVVQVYDPATDTWSSASDIPTPMAWLGAGSMGNRIVISGGYSGSNFLRSTYVGTVSGAQITWSQGRDYPKATGLIDCSVGTTADAAYFFTGVTYAAGEYYPIKESYAYDPNSDTWSMVEQKPTQVTAAKRAASDGAKIYLPGGSSADGETAVLEIFDSGKEAGAIAAVSPASVDSWIKTGTSDAAVSFTIRNLGVLDLTWSASLRDAVPWLSIENPDGVVAAGAEGELRMTIASSSLSTGEYSAEILLVSNDTEHPQITVPVTLHAQDEDVDTEMNVFVEQFTGTWCGYCPYGAEVLNDLKTELGDRLIRASWHSGDEMQHHLYDDFADFIQVPFYPSATISRIKWPGESMLAVDFETWADRAREVVNTMRSPVSLTIDNLVFDRENWSVKFEANAFFHQSVSGDVRINALLVEDNVNSPQKKYLLSGGDLILDPYYHMGVVRAISPNHLGEAISNQGNLVSQSTITRSFDLPVLSDEAAESHVVVFLHRLNEDGSPGPVMQAVSAPMAPLTDAAGVPAVGGMALHQNYPNPFNPGTRLSFTLPTAGRARLSVHDVYGRELALPADTWYPAGTHAVHFDGSALSSGTYVVRLSAGGNTLLRRITLIK